MFGKTLGFTDVSLFTESSRQVIGIDDLMYEAFTPLDLGHVESSLAVDIFSWILHPGKLTWKPENEPLEEEIPIRNHHFQVPC